MARLSFSRAPKEGLSEAGRPFRVVSMHLISNWDVVKDAGLSVENLTSYLGDRAPSSLDIRPFSPKILSDQKFS